MDVALNRKRSRLALDEDGEDEPRLLSVPSPAPSALSDGLKRSRTQGELEDLDTIPAEAAWGVDIDAILASDTRKTPEQRHGLSGHDNMEKYEKDGSIFVLCVQGSLQLHYDLLW